MTILYAQRVLKETVLSTMMMVIHDWNLQIYPFYAV